MLKCNTYFFWKCLNVRLIFYENDKSLLDLSHTLRGLFLYKIHCYSCSNYLVVFLDFKLNFIWHSEVRKWSWISTIITAIWFIVRHMPFDIPSALNITGNIASNLLIWENENWWSRSSTISFIEIKQAYLRTLSNIYAAPKKR